jgi:DNA ligase D-like protein (predicted ligase)
MQRMSPELRFHPPMECKPTEQVPTGEQWQYELKLDGYRTQAIKQRGEARLFSRNGKPFDERFPDIAEAILALRVKECVLDGEVVALDEQGRHSFSLLQNTRSKRAQLSFYIFDLLFLNGKDLTKLPLSQRRAALESLALPKLSRIQCSPVFQGEPAQIMQKIREFGFEGIVAKRLDSFYVHGEAPGTWLKHKTQQSADFVIGGYIPGTQGLDELLVGRVEGERLLFVESVKNGFVPATRATVFAAISDETTEECPFSNLPEKKGTHGVDREKMKKVRWVRPSVLVEIAFNEMTTAGHLRHSKFVRLREEHDTRRRAKGKRRT